MDQDQVTDELLARHIAGESSLDEDGAVARWVEASDANRIEYERLLAAWSARDPMPGLDVDKAWSAVSAQLDDDARPVDVIPIPRDSTWQVTALRIAAAIAVIVGVTYYAMRFRPIPDQYYATGPDERLELKLRDGSRVVLAPDTRLTVFEDYGRAHRNVSLDGAAWFNAVHGEHFAFKVATELGVVHDIGTIFTVESRSRARLEVGVIEGKVLVESYRPGVAPELGAGQVAVLTRDSTSARPTVSVVSGLPVDSLDRWHQQALDLSNVPVGTALAELTDWYGVAITFADTTLASRPITAKLSLTSLDDALDMVALLLDVTPVKDTSGRKPRVLLR
ncbi:MAG TPA: FecR domain-containing protein [Gemmatimonadales bacterium]|nr:FecR domain-containing protein [Gemmatimonadales bacterium]